MKRWQFAACIVIIGSLLLLCIAAFLGYLNVQSRPSSKYFVPDKDVQAFNAAQQRWASRPFTSYRMDVTFSSSQCEQDVEIHDEKVVITYLNSCNQPDETLSSLFAEIEQGMTTIAWHNGVGCELNVVHPTFNATWGYPEKIETNVEVVDQSNINEQAYTEAMATHTVCYLVNTDFDVFTTIKSFTPIYQQTF